LCVGAGIFDGFQAEAELDEEAQPAEFQSGFEPLAVDQACVALAQEGALGEQLVEFFHSAAQRAGPVTGKTPAVEAGGEGEKEQGRIRMSLLRVEPMRAR
jgi:hypothetical protein